MTTMITIAVPGELRKYCDGRAELSLSAATVRAALEELEQQYSTLHRGICDETGRLRRHINVFVNDSHMRERDGLETALVPGDVLYILPAVSGG